MFFSGEFEFTISCFIELIIFSCASSSKVKAYLDLYKIDFIICAAFLSAFAKL